MGTDPALDLECALKGGLSAVIRSDDEDVVGLLIASGQPDGSTRIHRLAVTRAQRGQGLEHALLAWLLERVDGRIVMSCSTWIAGRAGSNSGE